jgi:predicted metalloprotease with PDZ domain
MKRKQAGLTPSWGAILPILAAAWFFPPPARGETLQYELTPEFEKGVLHVDLTWETGQRKQSGLQISETVGPINDVPRLLKNLAIGAENERKGAVWVIQHRPGETLRCSYDVVTGKNAFKDWDDKHYPITTPRFFHGLGSAFLLVPAVGNGIPAEFEVLLRWKLPVGHKAVCSWGVGRTIGARVSAADLRQSVYLAGQIELATRQETGRTVTVAVFDRFGFSLDEFADMTADIIRRQCEFMNETAFPDFVVTAIPAGPTLKPGESRIAGSGLYNSFALFVAPDTRLDDAVEHLFAHELFHYWNGRLLKAEQPDRLVYWFIEGFTDYYALRILYESGRWNAATYAKWINKHIREYYLNPAINAANERIERDYWKERDTVGEVAYQRGLLLGLRWQQLAKKNGVADGFDRLFKTLVNRGRAGGFELSNPIMRQVGQEVLGAWFAGEFDRYVAQAQAIDLPPDALAPGLTGKITEVYAYEVGFDQRPSLKKQVVRGLKPDSEAARAGLRDGDQLVAWNIQGDPDVPVQLKVDRKGRTETITYLPRGEKRMVMQYRGE